MIVSGITALLVFPNHSLAQIGLNESRGTTAPPVDETGLTWSLPPTPWQGLFSFGGGQTFPGSSRTTFQGISARASTYVWQPWFLKADGNLSANRSTSKELGSHGSTDAYSLGLDGKLFPSSRFPVSVGGTLSNAKSEIELGDSKVETTEVQMTNIRLQGVYTPLDRAYTGNWAYSLVKLKLTTAVDEKTPDSKSQSLAGSLSVPISGENPQSINLSTAFSSNEKIRMAQLGASHTISLDEYVMTLSSSAGISQTDIDAPEEKNKSSLVQVNTSMGWIPSDDYPLSLAGTVKYFGTRVAGTATSTSSSYGLSASADYPLDRYWRFNGYLSAANSNNDSESIDTSSEFALIGANASWTGEGLTKKLGEWNYGLSYGSSLEVARSTIKSSDSTSVVQSSILGLSASQALTRAFPLDGGGGATLSFSESLGTGSPFNIYTVGHSVSYSYSALTSSDATLAIAGNIQDTRTFGERKQAFQQVSLSANSAMNVGRYSSLGANAMLNISSQGDVFGARAVGSGGLLVSYSHQRFADVSGLLYQSKYNMDIRESVSEKKLSLRGWDFSHAITQTWSWRAGLVGAKVDHSLSKAQGREIQQSITFSVDRDFSGML